nr:GtrA family protein [Streptomyces sp. SID13031]
MIRQIGTFGVIGAVSVLVQLVLYAVMRGWWGALSSNLLALTVCTILNTEANRRFTFGATGNSVGRVHLQGFMVFVGYYVVTSGALLLLGITVAATPRWLEIVVLVLASAVGTVGRFIVLRLWVFERVAQTTTQVQID